MNEAPIIAELREENTLLKQKYELVKQELAQLRRLIYGSKSERFKEESPDQLSLFASAVKEDPAPNIEAEDEVLPEEKKNHPGRGKLPEHLPVEEVICEPSGVLSDWERLSDVITETLDY
ncbi:IS66 family transposase, partial [Membranihabitans marinus]